MAENRNALDGRVEASTYLGDRTRLEIRMTDGSTLRATLPTGTGSGTAIRLTFAPEAATVVAA
nr:TOBE domain-containing protein [Methylobacterium sp. 77]